MVFDSHMRGIGLIDAAGQIILGDRVESIKVDVGCSDGVLMKLWLRDDPSLFAVGVEPNPSSVNKAREALAQEFGPEGGRWVVIHAALALEGETVHLHVPDDSPDQGSLLPPLRSQNVSVFEVQTGTLSSLLSLILSGRLNELDFLKTDCQGLDLEILMSGGEQLRRVKLITAEADSAGYEGASNDVVEMEKYLRKLNFIHLNKRSRIRRKIGSFLHWTGIGPLFRLRLPTFSRHKLTSSSQIVTEDPTFANCLYLEEITSGKISAFQRG